MTTRTTHISIHRHNDNVAVVLGDGPTRYLSPDLADWLATHLQEYVANCRSVPFTQSAFGTVEINTDVPLPTE